MDPQTLIDATAATALPAPWWFIRLLKVLGFALHAAPMNLWYAGVLLSMLCYAGGGERGRRLARRLMTQMPVILAYGINFGIVPLLFLQLAYGKVFYPATVLMAWFWLAIIALLTLGYYGVYLHAFGWRAGANRVNGPRQAAGWCAAVLLLGIGFIFANGLSLMTNVQGWPGLWQAHGMAGAALGTALNLGDATLWPRWLMMFGLALTTTAAWVVVDLGFFAAREGEDYKRWAQRLALKLDSAGLVWFAIAGSWYVFGTWSADVRNTMFHGGLTILTVLTALAPGLPWLLILAIRRRGAAEVDRRLAALVGLAQFGVLAINAVSRQTVQELELGIPGYFNASAQPVEVQWSPLLVFLALFVAGLAVVVWMVVQAAKAPAQPTRQDVAV